MSRTSLWEERMNEAVFEDDAYDLGADFSDVAELERGWRAAPEEDWTIYAGQGPWED